MPRLARIAIPGVPQHWKAAFLKNTGKRLEEVRFHTRRGRPFGGDKFVAKMKALVGHRIRPLPVGRPKKAKEK